MAGRSTGSLGSMNRYMVALAVAIVTGCALDVSTLPDRPCPNRPCFDPPEAVVASAKVLGFHSLWEITQQCGEHDTKMMAGVFRVSARTKVTMAFWGRDSQLTRTAIVRALDQPGIRTTNLKLTFFGEPTDANIVKAAVLASGGTYIEAPMLPNNAFERTVEQGGPRLAAASIPCPAAQLSR